MIILIGGEKGGTGKSTIATNLAIMRTMVGRSVLLLDTDKQESSSKFISNRNERKLPATPPCVQLRGKYLGAEIENLSNKYDDIIIDAGGRDSVELRAAMASHWVTAIYSPLQPSEFDLETLAKMDELVYLSRAYNPGLKAFIVFNQAPTHSKITVVDEAKQYTTETFENVKICNTVIGHRIAVQYAPTCAQSVVEFESERIKGMPSYQAKNYSKKSSVEFCVFYEEVFGQQFSGGLD